ncbi:TPA: replicative DNA helicase [Candidatus Dojkabacteria bacterium]|jgi:replicative DNA helicase|uniref:Replicative DNA helicase n=1 Tax=Candidatus Dojkabacteria bacterium TaxID=2099670 RepID=A0A832QD75_9BACT|nr:replicative DNA helicase [Candidatus Dojkabacteria bacterium]
MKDKLPPQNIDVEKSLLGCMLMDKDAIITVSSWLLPGHFYDAKHVIIYSAIMDLFNNALPVDLVTVVDKLKKQKKLTAAGGASYVAELMTTIATSTHAEEYAEIIKESAVRRGLIAAAGHIKEIAFDEDKPIDEVIDKSEKEIFDVAQTGTKVNFVHIKDLLKEAYERAERADKDESYLGVSTGFKDLDELLGGFQKSDLIILAARPSVGKTALALDMMRHAALVEKKTVAFFSLEMSKTQIMERFLGMQSGIPFWEIRTGRLTEKKFMKLASTMGELGDANIYIDDQAGQHINSLRTKARRLALESNVDIIFVDYLQLMQGNNRESRTLEVGEISQGLKNIAKELDVPVVALSQLSRAIEQRQSRRPQLSDLRESGSIEQDADVVMFIDREETWNPETENKGTGDLIVAKHRNGPTGDIKLAFIPEIASFRNLYRAKK